MYLVLIFLCKIDSEKPRGDEPVKYLCMYVLIVTNESSDKCFHILRVVNRIEIISLGNKRYCCLNNP